MRPEETLTPILVLMSLSHAGCSFTASSYQGACGARRHRPRSSEAGGHAGLPAHIVVSLLSSLRQGCAAQLLLRTKQALAAKDANLTEFRMSTGRLVIVRLIPMPSRPIERPAQPAPGVAPRSQVGDTHGQLNDFCWILRSHGHPAPGNVYLINGDVADRGRFAFPLAY